MTKNAIQGQQDIFSMFDIVDEYAEQKKREEEERARKAEALRKQVESQRAANSESNKKDKKENEKDVFDINENTIIRYFGESIEIQTYFSAEELAEGLLVKKKDGGTERKPLDGELLRKRMEKDYPELVKDMTDMVYIKDKNIVIPFMKAKKKGNCTETSSIFEDVSFPIPFSLLRDFIALARLYAEQYLEIHADVYIDTKGRFFLDVPQQRVHRYWCEVDEDSFNMAIRIGGDSKKILEIHSHHMMPPLPSLQDNVSERVPGMTYAIVGCLHKPFPEIYVRRFISEEVGHVSVPYHLVFEDPFSSLPDFNMNRIQVVVE